MASDSVVIDSQLLSAWPLPRPDGSDDKEARGRILIVGGSKEMPGALLLAAEAALRAGAGKLTVMTADAVAGAFAVQLPEALVIGLPQTPDGGLILDAARCRPDEFDAVLAGPGMQDEPASIALVHDLIERVRSPFVLDALAINALRGGALNTPVLITPHAGEMAHLTGIDKPSIVDSPAQCARQHAHAWNAVVALKGATTWIAAPTGSSWCYRGGNPGLAVSGSGDVLAGIIAGLVAQGASLEQAAVWGVALHAAAGDELARSVGRIGFLPRELPALIPSLMQRFADA